MIEIAASETFQAWSNPARHDVKWMRRARVAARMCRAEHWVCDLGCGMQTLKSFLPRSVVYLPADLKQWTSDTEICDLDAGKMPTRSLELCDICVMLGVIGHLRNPESSIQNLSRQVERILISFNSTDFTRSGRAPSRARAFALSEIYAILERAGFRIIDQNQYVQHTLIKAQNERFDATSRRLRDERRAAFAPRKWTLGDEWVRCFRQMRTIRTALHRI